MLEKEFMRRALKLASKGESWTNPNPLVGAVLVKNNKVISEGFHEKFGGNHAEVNAIAHAGKNAGGSTLFVNLEPCSHYGNTPPCTDAIIKAGIKKVIYGSSDPSQHKSSEILTNAGIEVISGVLKAEADFLNRQFLYYARNKLPYVTLKFAASLDGKLATKTYDSKWITNEHTRKYARSLRASHQAVLVGSNTVLRDDPHLGAREKNKKDPIRIVLDTGLKTQVDAKVYRDSRVIVLAGKEANDTNIDKFRDKKIIVHQFGSDKIEVHEVLKYLATQKIISVMVEGGGEVIGSFADSKIVNEVCAFYAPIIVGGGNARVISGIGVEKIQEAIKIKNPKLKKIDDNFLIYGLV
ncbi:MAG: bifunctional diaminohydroxyphosphoribosylaminopyrimidine deaminase/5-amino-6-(5-phosphoribosylamino)uracil reductase RibD [Candidatus Saccharimonadales bacterium]